MNSLWLTGNLVIARDLVIAVIGNPCDVNGLDNSDEEILAMTRVNSGPTRTMFRLQPVKLSLQKICCLSVLILELQLNRLLEYLGNLGR